MGQTTGQTMGQIMVQSTGSDPAERRQSPRLGFGGWVALHWLGPSAVPALTVLVDLSATGMRITSGHRVPIGMRGQAMFAVPDQLFIGRRFVVVWSIEMPDGSFDSGCRFTDSFE